MRGAEGFALAELIVTIVVVSIAGLVFATVFREAVRSYELIDLEKDLLQEARYAQAWITREIMQTPAAGGLRTAGRRGLTLLSPDSATVSFSWNGVRGSDLVYARNGAASPLASNVDSLAFAYYGSDGAPVAEGAASLARRVAFFLRLAKDGHHVDAVGGAFLRAR